MRGIYSVFSIKSPSRRIRRVSARSVANWTGYEMLIDEAKCTDICLGCGMILLDTPANISSILKIPPSFLQITIHSPFFFPQIRSLIQFIIFTNKSSKLAFFLALYWSFAQLCFGSKMSFYQRSLITIAIKIEILCSNRYFNHNSLINWVQFLFNNTDCLFISSHCTANVFD